MGTPAKNPPGSYLGFKCCFLKKCPLPINASYFLCPPPATHKCCACMRVSHGMPCVEVKGRIATVFRPPTIKPKVVGFGDDVPLCPRPVPVSLASCTEPHCTFNLLDKAYELTFPGFCSTGDRTWLLHILKSDSMQKEPGLRSRDDHTKANSYLESLGSGKVVQLLRGSCARSMGYMA